MADARAAAARVGGVALLERAIGYTLGVLSLVTPEDMGHATPCTEWDLRALLRHMNDSFLALAEAVDIGHVALSEPGCGSELDPVGTLKDRAGRLMGAWADLSGPDPVSIAGCPLSASIVVSAGAVEVAVHGWDVAEACGRPRPIPAALAEELLELCPLFVGPADRPGRFAPAVRQFRHAGPSDRLVGFLGRRAR